jgi:fused signal recognition particle receptor
MSEQTDGSGESSAPAANEGDVKEENGTADGERRGLFSRIRARMDAAADAPESASDEPGPGGEPARPAAQSTATPPAKAAIFGRLKSRLSRTHHSMVDGLADFFEVKRTIDDEAMEALETSLLMADVGVDATQAIVGDLTARVSRRELQDLDALMAALQESMEGLLAPVSRPLAIPDSETPFVVLMVGINGAGKTTTIGKLARRFMAEGHSVMLAAGDTFRAAAVEQLQAWGERNGVPVISQQTGADSASVIFDAVEAARARGVDVVIADTAGRLHTQTNLMEELRKIHRVVAKLDAAAPQEVMLVVDAGTGQNALAQAVQFNEAVPLTGISLTKLDGTAKGGIIFAIAKRLGVPVRFIGVGETADDLRVFDANEFVAALLGRDPSDRR